MWPCTSVPYALRVVVFIQWKVQLVYPVDPVNKQSIREAYSNKDPNLQVAELKSVRVHCPKPGDTTHREKIIEYSSFRFLASFTRVDL